MPFADPPRARPVTQPVAKSGRRRPNAAPTSIAVEAEAPHSWASRYGMGAAQRGANYVEGCVGRARQWSRKAEEKRGSTLQAWAPLPPPARRRTQRMIVSPRPIHRKLRPGPLGGGPTQVMEGEWMICSKKIPLMHATVLL
eukprot:6195796-Pleurochrysis_carterae.AAC.2